MKALFNAHARAGLQYIARACVYAKPHLFCVATPNFLNVILKRRSDKYNFAVKDR